MFVKLPANTPVDLYAASKIAVGDRLNAYNPTDVPVVIYQGADKPTRDFARVPLSPKSTFTNSTEKPNNPGAWAISVHMNTQIEVTAFESTEIKPGADYSGAGNIL